MSSPFTYLVRSPWTKLEIEIIKAHHSKLYIGIVSLRICFTHSLQQHQRASSKCESVCELMHSMIIQRFRDMMSSLYCQHAEVLLFAILHCGAHAHIPMRLQEWLKLTQACAFRKRSQSVYPDYVSPAVISLTWQIQSNCPLLQRCLRHKLVACRQHAYS